MYAKATLGLSLVALLSLGSPRAAHAQFAVIDVAAITQLVQQVSTLEQQLATAESQLSQARNEYAAIAGESSMKGTSKRTRFFLSAERITFWTTRTNQPTRFVTFSRRLVQFSIALR